MTKLNTAGTSWALTVLAFAIPSLGIAAPRNSVGFGIFAIQERESSTWGAADVRHLLTRAGFGASSSEVKRWSKRSQEELVEHLLAAKGQAFDFRFPELPVEEEGTSEEELKKRRTKRDNKIGEDLRNAWVQRLLSGKRPLEERMTLFWHGFFTSEQRVVKNHEMMAVQNQTLRVHALGSYAELLKVMLQDPALLIYLDNDKNKKGKPNENLARELMELFSLGEGNYSEEDVREAARVLTGHTVRKGKYRFERKRHDGGEKALLGEESVRKVDELVDLILTQPACAEWLAWRLLVYFEGAPPEAERHASYAELLRSEGYHVRPFLRRLFLDPAFYASRGQRVQGPLDFLIGFCRRTGFRPPQSFLVSASDLLGQCLFDPPSVQGWPGGWAWIDTGTVMTRANLVGALLGEVGLNDLADKKNKQARKTRLGKLLSSLEKQGYEAKARLGKRLRLEPGASDAEWVDALVQQLVPAPLAEDSRARILEGFRLERDALGLVEGQLDPAQDATEDLLRAVCVLLFSLPEVHLS